MILRLLLTTLWVFKAKVVFLALKQKSVLLVASLFYMKGDLSVFDTKKWILGARVLVVSIKFSSGCIMCLASKPLNIGKKNN